jgi:general secretion pathway protein I
MRKQRGFTLLEVMISLAVIAIALSILVRSVGTNIRETQELEALTVATTLARSKVYDVEEQLIKDGFLETDQSTEGDFGDEGWPDFTWQAKVDKIEIPSFDQLQAMQNATAAGSGAGAGSGSGSGAEANGFDDTALGGMMSLLGGSSDAAGAAGGSFIQQQFQLVQDVLEASMRKVTLTVKWKVLGRDKELPVVVYLTDPAGMNKVIGSLGADPAAPPPTPTP